MSARKSSYTPVPSVPKEQLPRLAAVVEALAGLKSVAEAARSLGMSRNHFQTILHRAVLALAQSITPKKGGRPARASTVLEAQLKKLQRENARLQRRVDATERLLEVAGGLLKGRIRPTGRQRRTKSAASSREHGDDSDPTNRPDVLAAVAEMRALGLTQRLAAAIVGVDVATLRRWRAHALATGEPCSKSTRRRIEPSTAAQAEQLVRALHGLIGAQALSHSIAGLSRRAAASVKAHTLRAMERERKTALLRVHVTQPGIVRGLDAMYVATLEGSSYALISADASVPYRTGFVVGRHYDTHLVERAVRDDLERNGAPLVLRMDRARAQNAPLVRQLLDHHGVLVLHGPPHYPSFYGQLERQNREHRAWLGQLPCASRAALELCLQQMLESVNTLWRRRTLNWHSAAELWNARPPLTTDRIAFREEVHDRATSIARSLRSSQPEDLAERLAIERTLERMGYLRQEIGGWC
jgi:transposase